MIIFLFIYLFSLKWPNPTFPPSWLGKSNTLTLFGKTRIKPTHLNLCPFRQGATRAFFFLFIYLFIYYFFGGGVSSPFVTLLFLCGVLRLSLLTHEIAKFPSFEGAVMIEILKFECVGTLAFTFAAFVAFSFVWCCVFLNGGFLFVILEIT